MELDGILPFVNLVIIEMILSSGKVARLVKKPSVVVRLNHAINASVIMNREIPLPIILIETNDS